MDSNTVSVTWGQSTHTNILTHQTSWQTHASPTLILRRRRRRRRRIAFKGVVSRFFTICSLRRELSPKHTLKWPRHNHVKIICNTSSAYHVQHVLCHLVQRDSSAIQFESWNRIYFSFTLWTLTIKRRRTLIQMYSYSRQYNKHVQPNTNINAPAHWTAWLTLCSPTNINVLMHTRQHDKHTPAPHKHQCSTTHTH